MFIHMKLVLSLQDENIYKQDSSSNKSQNNYKNTTDKATEESRKKRDGFSSFPPAVGSKALVRFRDF